MQYVRTPYVRKPYIRKRSWRIGSAAMLALLVAVFGFTAPGQAQPACESPYIVQSGDTLFRIASRCDTTVQALLDANSAIANPNLIRVGQRLELPVHAMPEPETDTPHSPHVTLVPTAGAPGTEIQVRISGFPSHQALVLALGVAGEPAAHSVEETTDAQGRLQTDMTLPSGAQPGEQWTVRVWEEGRAEPMTATSGPFLVGTGEEHVSIAPREGPPGAEIEVSASGFPAHTPVSLGIGRYGAEPVSLSSAQTDGQGHVRASLALPDSAEIGSEWAAVVGTEDWRISEFSEVFQVIEAPVSDAPETGDPAGGFVLHTVQRGEWLSRIARRYETTVAAVLELNPEIDNPNLIYVGRQIRVPSHEMPRVSQVQVYLLALNDRGERGPEIGCQDSIVPVTVDIEPTAAPLEAALALLLEMDGSERDLANVFDGSALAVEGVDIRNRTATVRLGGELQIRGVCDHPRIEEQLERTARQFDTVDSVDVFVNDEPLSRILSVR